MMRKRGSYSGATNVENWTGKPKNLVIVGDGVGFKKYVVKWMDGMVLRQHRTRFIEDAILLARLNRGTVFRKDSRYEEGEIIYDRR
jgi:hypothetical protein